MNPADLCGLERFYAVVERLESLCRAKELVLAEYLETRFLYQRAFYRDNAPPWWGLEKITYLGI